MTPPPTASPPSASPSSPRLTLGTALNQYWDWHALRGSSKRHQGDLRLMLGAFGHVAGVDQPLDGVTREDCSRFLRSVQERGLKPNTVLAYHRVLDAFFHWLVEEGHLVTSPMKRVPKPNAAQEPIQPLSPEELTQLLGQPDRDTFTGLRDVAFIALLADTGLRLSEAPHIRLTDVDLHRRSISVVGKGSKPRTVFYGESAARFIRDYCRRRGEVKPDDLLFVSCYDEPLLRFSMSKRIRAYGNAAGIVGKRVSPHTLRHTFAISWLRGGGDAFSLQRLLGHSTSAMTARYVHFASDDLARLHRTVSPLDRLQGDGLKPKARPHGRRRHQ